MAAFCLAAWLGLVGNGALRRLARKAGSRGTPAVSDHDLRRLGGFVVVLATLAAWVLVPGREGWVGATALAGVLVAVAGLASERRVIANRARLLVIAGAATIVVAAGVRGSLFGTDTVDAVVTVAWIVVVTNAFSRLGHSDDLATTVGFCAATGIFGVAIGHDRAIAVVAFALAGACVAALTFNLRPASLAVGRSGIGFAGFVVAVLTVEMDPSAGGPNALVVPLLLTGLPLANLVAVTTQRLWQGVPLGHPRRDHLAHQLRARGWPYQRVLATLVGAQAVLTVVAVLVGRDLVSGAWAFLAAAVVLGMLAGRPGRAAAPTGAPRPRSRLVLEVGFVALLVLVGLMAVVAWQGYDRMRAGERALDQALTAGRDGDAEAAGAAFERAADAFAGADRWLNGPLGYVGRAVPVLAENFRATGTLADSGVEVAEAGRELAEASGDRLRVRGGVVPVEEVRRVTPDIEAAAALLGDVLDRLDGLRRPLLLGPVQDRVDAIAAELAAAAAEADHAVAGAHLAPAIFGGDEPRRYFLAVQNPAELRATGGIIGNWGILTAVEGDVELDEFRRTRELNEDGVDPEDSTRTLPAPPEFVQRYDRFTPAQIWQNLNMSPDFPTVGRVISELYPQATGEHVDGVIGVDPLGLEALLELTGPVTVADWPEPITAENVVDVTLRRQYDAFGQTEREEFLGDVAEAVWDQALEGNLGNPARLAKILGEAAREGHLQLWFTDPDEAVLATRLGVGGGVPPLASDSLLVTSQNSSGNKVDFYLTRELDYSVELEPTGADGAAVNATLDVQLTNAAPAGISSVALGPFNESFQPGENRSFVSVYSPLTFTAASLDGLPTALETATELGRNVFSRFVRIPAGEARTLSLDLAGGVSLTPDGWYEIDVVRQPVLWPDQVSIEVEVPDGWRITATEGLELLGPRRAGFDGPLERTDRLALRVAPDG